MSAPWFMPTTFMGTVMLQVVTEGSGWGDDSEISMDVVPRNTGEFGQYTKAPFEPTIPGAWLGFAPELGPITNPDTPDRYRVVWNGRSFTINRIRDWDGFFVFFLDRIKGNA